MQLKYSTKLALDLKLKRKPITSYALFDDDNDLVFAVAGEIVTSQTVVQSVRDTLKQGAISIIFTDQRSRERKLCRVYDPAQLEALSEILSSILSSSTSESAEPKSLH